MYNDLLVGAAIAVGLLGEEADDEMDKIDDEDENNATESGREPEGVRDTADVATEDVGGSAGGGSQSLQTVIEAGYWRWRARRAAYSRSWSSRRGAIGKSNILDYGQK